MYVKPLSDADIALDDIHSVISHIYMEQEFIRKSTQLQ